jgi:hypothetical protein
MKYMPDDFLSQISKHQNLSEAAQKKAGQPAGDDMGDEHKNFLALVIRMIDQKEVDVSEPSSFLKKENYDALNDMSKAQVDLGLVNIVDQLRRIEEFYRNKKTPNASPELQTMIEHLWQMKDRVESKYGDVLKL